MSEDTRTPAEREWDEYEEFYFVAADARAQAMALVTFTVAGVRDGKVRLARAMKALERAQRSAEEASKQLNLACEDAENAIRLAATAQNLTH